MKPLKEVWNLWKRLAGAVTLAAAWLLLALLYAALVLPMRLLGLFGCEKRADNSRWSKLEGLTRTIEEASRQY